MGSVHHGNGSASRLTKSEALARLKQEVRHGLPPGKSIVFGEGNPNATLVVVGEAPGREEEAAGRPFVGRAGQLLNEMLSGLSLKREELWITNVVKWHPTEAKGNLQSTRSPNASEVRVSLGWLDKELRTIAPRLILCLGNMAAGALIDSRFRMKVDHGRWREGRLGVETLATFHPAYALRQGARTGEVLDLMRQDLQIVKARYDEIRSRRC